MIPLPIKKEKWKGKRNGKVIAFQIPFELYEEIENYCKKYGIKKSEFIRHAVIQYLQSQNQNKNS